MVDTSKTRRKRKRRPTLTPRFGNSSVALELGLLRLALDAYREAEKKDEKEGQK